MVRAKVVTVMRWYAQDEVNQESEQNEVDGMKKKKGDDSTRKVLWFLMTADCISYCCDENSLRFIAALTAQIIVPRVTAWTVQKTGGRQKNGHAHVK